MLKCVCDAKISRSGDFHADNDRQNQLLYPLLVLRMHAWGKK